ncbi:MAG: cobalamin-dependent protein [Magnetococcales bacterium]|nr:cobalamin-dependent protein [Magnetococcales bacterium]
MAIISDTLYEAYFQNLLSGKRRQTSEIVQTLMNEQIPIPVLYEKLMQKSMYQVGDLWEKNQLSVATEHMATAITEGLLNQVYPQFERGESVGKCAVVGSVEKELHQVGAKMVCDILELNGWEAFYLGASTPTSEMIGFIEEKRPDIIGLSMSIYFNLPGLEKMIAAIRSAFPDIPIIIGGQGLSTNGTQIAKKGQKVYYISTLEDLTTFLDKPEFNPRRQR